MPEYRITWTIDEWADTPEEAARQARARLLDPDSIADVFEVTVPMGGTEKIDLSELDGRPIN